MTTRRLGPRTRTDRTGCCSSGIAAWLGSEAHETSERTHGHVADTGARACDRGRTR